MQNISDVLEVNNSGYKLLMENDEVRVMNMELKPGEKSPMHNHPNNHAVYIFNDSKIKLSFPDGTSNEFELSEGQVLWIESGSHEAENIGETEVHNLVTEIK